MKSNSYSDDWLGKKYIKIVTAIEYSLYHVNQHSSTQPTEYTFVFNSQTN